LTSPLISFDPGLREAGLAVFIEGRLAFACLVRNPEARKRDGPAWRLMGREVFRVIYDNHIIKRNIWDSTLASEIPQVYQEGKSAGVDPSDLTNLSGVVGAVIGYLNPDQVFTYLPREWKGQIPKDKHQPRIISRLDKEETAVLNAVRCPKGKLHNVVDAIGVGLFHLGRIGGFSSKLGD
jgi:hypothetical protein